MIFSINQNKSLIQFVSIALPAVLLIILLSGYDMKEAPDSRSYTNLADAILSGDFFVKKDPSEVTFGRLVRTPGYPLMIALTKLVLPDASASVLYLHLIISVASLVFLSVSLARYCPPILTGLVVVALSILMKDYYALVMTEWVAFNILLVIFGLVVNGLRNPSITNLVLLGLVASVAVLVRPSVIPVMLLVPMLVIIRGRLRLGEGVLLAVTVLPVLLWMGFNQYQLGSFTLAQLSGHNLFGIGALIGHADEEPGDSPELQNFIRDVNEQKYPRKGAEAEFMGNLDANYNTIRFDSNIFWIAYPLKPGKDVDLIAFDSDYLGVYGRRAIRDNPGNYAKYVLHGMKNFVLFGSSYATLYLLAIPLFCLWKKHNVILAWAALGMFAVHLGQALVCATFQAVFERYLAVTFYPYLGAVIFCLIGLVFAYGLHERLLAMLPVSARAMLDGWVRIG